MGKREYYSQKNVASKYDDRRFGGKSGHYVDSREVSCIKDLMQEKGLILDLATGTGRFAVALAEDGKNVVAADFSKEMLEEAQKKSDMPLVRCDAFRLPFDESSFDGTMSLRFILHYEDFDTFLKELSRVTKPGGTVLFDTYAWSAQTNFFFSRTFDGKVFLHTDEKVKETAKKYGLTLVKQRQEFLLSPTWYRYIPFVIVKALDSLEKKLSEKRRVRTFWKFRKDESPKMTN